VPARARSGDVYGENTYLATFTTAEEVHEDTYYISTVQHSSELFKYNGSIYKIYLAAAIK